MFGNRPPIASCSIFGDSGAAQKATKELHPAEGVKPFVVIVLMAGVHPAAGHEADIPPLCQAF